METRRLPGEVRDAVVEVLADRPNGASVAEIVAGVHEAIGEVPRSSVRSYLRLNTPRLFVRQSRGHYSLKEASATEARTPPSAGRTNWPTHCFGRTVLYKADCLEWLASQEPNSIHAVVTDPPYGLVEYSAKEQGKLRKRKGGVWRLPPSFDGATRSPLPRFTVLSRTDLDRLALFFVQWAKALNPVLVPGANVVVAANPLMSHLVAVSLAQAGLERRGEIVRLVTTMRGGDSSEGCAHRVQRRQRNAAIHVGTVAGFPQASRGPSARQPPQVGRRRFSPPLPGKAIWRRHSLVAYASRRTSACPASQSQTATVPSPSRQGRVASGPRRRPRSVLRQRLDVGRRPRRRLPQHRRGKRCPVLRSGAQRHSTSSPLSSGRTESVTAS